MVTIRRARLFRSKFDKIKDEGLRRNEKVQIRKILENPAIGKAMRHERKGTRELYVRPFRLSYAYLRTDNRVIRLDLYHKKKQ